MLHIIYRLTKSRRKVWSRERILTDVRLWDRTTYILTYIHTYIHTYMYTGAHCGIYIVYFCYEDLAHLLSDFLWLYIWFMEMWQVSFGILYCVSVVNQHFIFFPTFYFYFTKNDVVVEMLLPNVFSWLLVTQWGRISWPSCGWVGPYDRFCPLSKEVTCHPDVSI